MRCLVWLGCGRLLGLMMALAVGHSAWGQFGGPLPYRGMKSGTAARGALSSELGRLPVLVLAAGMVLGFRLWSNSGRTVWLKAAGIAGLIVLAFGPLSSAQEPEAPPSPSPLKSLFRSGKNALERLFDPETDVADMSPSSPEPTALPLDLSKVYNAGTSTLHNENGKLSGRVVFDRMPFRIGGTLRLFGQTQDERGDKQPACAKGLSVGRAFKDLHLVHYATWPDADGQAVAYVCLNYDDGTEEIFSLRYGVHLRDWFNLPSYEKEAVKDPNTTICWRRDPEQYKAPVRLFMTRLANPTPDKVVKTIDFVSARNLAGYNVIAATVADNCPAHGKRTVHDRHFDGKLRILVVDDSTEQPIEDAQVYPSMSVQDEGVVGSPFYTSSAGQGTVPFPTKDTKYITVTVKKEGYDPGSHYWESPQTGEFTFRLSPAKNM